RGRPVVLEGGWGRARNGDDAWQGYGGHSPPRPLARAPGTGRALPTRATARRGQPRRPPPPPPPPPPHPPRRRAPPPPPARPAGGRDAGGPPPRRTPG